MKEDVDSLEGFTLVRSSSAAAETAEAAVGGAG
jgi:hypothetical protein